MLLSIFSIFFMLLVVQWYECQRVRFQVLARHGLVLVLARGKVYAAPIVFVLEAEREHGAREDWGSLSWSSSDQCRVLLGVRPFVFPCRHRRSL